MDRVGCIKLSYVLGPSPSNWRTTIHFNLASTRFCKLHGCHHLNFFFYYYLLLFSNRGEKVLKSSKILVRRFNLLPPLENNDTLKCSLDSFPLRLTYVLFMENGRNFISLYRCSQIAGRRL